MTEQAKDFARVLRGADQCSNAGQACGPTTSTEPIDPKRILLQRMAGHEAYLMKQVRRLNDLASILKSSQVLPETAQKAILAFVEAALANL